MFKPTNEMNFQADLILLSNKEAQLINSYFLYLDLKNQDSNAIIYLIDDYISYINYLTYLNKIYKKELIQIMSVNYNRCKILSLYIYGKKIRV
jgi:hypothetical protein